MELVSTAGNATQTKYKPAGLVPARRGLGVGSGRGRREVQGGRMALGHVARQGQAREVGARGRGQLRGPVHRERVRQAQPQSQLLAGGEKAPRLLGWGGPREDEGPRVCWPVAVEGGRRRRAVGGLGEESPVVDAGVGAHHWEVLWQGLGQSRICQD